MNQQNFDFDAPDRSSGRPKARRFLLHLAILVGFLALVAVPLIGYGSRAERARWQAAAGLNRISAGATESGIEKIRDAVELSGNNSELNILLAETLTRFEQPEEGLALAESLLETDPTSVVAIHIKSDCEQQLGRPLEALTTMKSLEDQLDQSLLSQSTWRNNLAYYRALADVELDLARRDMRTVLADHFRSNFWSFKFNLPLETQTIVSIAQLSRKLDRSLEGAKFLDRNISQLVQAAYAKEQLTLNGVNALIEEDFPPSPESEQMTTMDSRARSEQSNAELAVLLVVRALREQADGEVEQCDQDRLRVTQLGFDPDEIARFLPPDSYYLNTLQLASTYLDTYGFVLYRWGNFQQAEKSLSLAVIAAKYNLLGLDSPLNNSSSESPKFEYSRIQSELKKTLATLYYHRMLVYRELGRVEVATAGRQSGSAGKLEEADAERIRALGFDPAARMF